jgi:hypothetical protein
MLSAVPRAMRRFVTSFPPLFPLPSLGLDLLGQQSVTSMLASEGESSTKFCLDFISKLCLACPSDAGRWGPDFEVRLFYCIRIAEFLSALMKSVRYLFSTWCVTYFCNLVFVLIKPVVVLIGFNCVSCLRINFHMGQEKW